MENFIKNNKNLFNTDEPSTGHLNHFLEKLENQKRITRIRFIKKTYSLAAVVTFMLFSAVLASLIYNGGFYSINSQKISQISIELNELETYYESNFSKELVKFEELSCANSDINKEEILNELKSFDITYLELERELEQNKENEIIINAMILNKQDRSEFLNNIMKRVKESC